MCWQSHAQSAADNDPVQFCGTRLIEEVARICNNSYFKYRRSEILDDERSLVLDLRSLMQDSFSRRNISNECCKRPCTPSHIKQYYCGRRSSTTADHESFKGLEAIAKGEKSNENSIIPSDTVGFIAVAGHDELVARPRKISVVSDVDSLLTKKCVNLIDVRIDNPSSTKRWLNITPAYHRYAVLGGCGPNQTTISRTRCDPVCYSDKPLCAPKDSPQKCFCKRGYKRLAHDFAAPCVVPKDCIKCGKNQEYKMCGSACPEYCGKPAGTVCGCGPNQTTISRTRCDPVCYSDKRLCAPKDSPQKCFCKRGYKRLAHDFAAPCVVPKDCIKCGKNQEYKMCGSACPEYCGKPAGTECKLPCVRGCFCKDGYILKAERSNECILKKDCPPKY
ncbi:riddle [Holotrichia oblita]|uniref:Riddle n=1 Tax=Holotrichia oblita TaxID=644536 RepID=A0ACB9T9G5_HOLOL|nr:riddle [Holotrichia oblita]